MLLHVVHELVGGGLPVRLGALHRHAERVDQGLHKNKQRGSTLKTHFYILYWCISPGTQTGSPDVYHANIQVPPCSET